MKMYTGTSGWSYAWWKNTVYPPSLKAGLWLPYYASQLDAVEVNNSFYRMPGLPMVAKWVDAVPPGFRFTVKAWQEITHKKRLKHCAEELALLKMVLDAFGEKLGAVLFQLPPSLRYDAGLLGDFLAQLPQPFEYAMEFRHTSWFREETYAALRDHGVAVCQAHLCEWVTPQLCTAAHAYIRLHGTEGLYKGAYSEAFLAALLNGLKAQDVQAAHVYFNNTDSPAAVQNAQLLSTLAGAKTA